MSGGHRAARLSIALLLAACLAQGHVQVVYMTDSAPNFVDGDEQAQTFVVGFGKEGVQQGLQGRMCCLHRRVCLRSRCRHAAPTIPPAPARSAFAAGHQQPSRPHRTMLMRSANGTSYRCYIPDPAAAAAADASGGSSSVSTVGGWVGAVCLNGPAALYPLMQTDPPHCPLVVQAAEGSLLAQKTPSQLLEALGEGGCLWAG